MRVWAHNEEERESAREFVVPERSTNEDRMMKRHNVESTVSSGNTSSSGNRDQR